MPSTAAKQLGPIHVSRELILHRREPVEEGHDRDRLGYAVIKVADEAFAHARAGLAHLLHPVVAPVDDRTSELSPGVGHLARDIHGNVWHRVAFVVATELF